MGYWHIGDYEFKEWTVPDNEAFYDIFTTKLSLENYKFLYEIYYKYDSNYIHELYFKKYDYNDYLWYGFAWPNDDLLAKPIRAKSSEILKYIDLKKLEFDENFLNFLFKNLV